MFFGWVGPVALVLTFLSFFGCERTIRPTSVLHVKKDATVEELLVLYDLRYRQLSSLKGLARVDVKTPSTGKQSFQAALYLTRPNGFRMRGFDLFGGTLFELDYREGVSRLSVGGEVQSEEIDELIGPTGPLRPGFSDLLGIPQFAPGEVPVLEKGTEYFYLMVVLLEADHAPQLKKKFVIERGDFRVEKAMYYAPSGFPEATLTYDDFRRVEEYVLPFRIMGESAYGEARLQFMEIVANPPPKKVEAGFHAAPRN